MTFLRPEGLSHPPDWKETTKGHGRIEERSLWLFRCEDDMRNYLSQVYGWPGAQWCGWLRRKRLFVSTQQTEESVHVWLAGAHFAWPLKASEAGKLLREHWAIENKVFYVRDVTMGEDRLHGRKIGYALSGIRNLALSLLRRMDFPYIPDARRHLAARSDLGLPLLL